MSISSVSEAPSLSVENLSVGYRHSQVLFGLSLNVAQAQTVAILGRNGAGKTTLLQALMGEIAANAGTVRT